MAGEEPTGARSVRFAAKHTTEDEDDSGPRRMRTKVGEQMALSIELTSQANSGRAGLQGPQSVSVTETDEEDHVEPHGEEQDRTPLYTPSAADANSTTATDVADYASPNPIAVSSSWQGRDDLHMNSSSSSDRRPVALPRPRVVTLLVGLLVFVVALVIFVLYGFSPVQTTCSSHEREAACPVHAVSQYTLLAILLASVVNIGVAPLHRRVISCAAVLLMLLGVLQVTVTLMPLPDSETQTLSSQTGTCVHVNNERQASLSGADASGLNALLEECKISDQFIHVPAAWRASIAGQEEWDVEDDYEVCSEKQRLWNLLERLAKSVTMSDASKLSLASVFVQILGPDLWSSWSSLSEEEQSSLADAAGLVLNKVVCNALLPTCNEDCSYPSRLSQSYCEYAQNVLRSSEGELPDVALVFRKGYDASAVLTTLGQMGFAEPASLFVGLFSIAQCLDTGWQFDVSTTKSQTDCLPVGNKYIATSGVTVEWNSTTGCNVCYNKYTLGATPQVSFLWGNSSNMTNVSGGHGAVCDVDTYSSSTVQIVLQYKDSTLQAADRWSSVALLSLLFGLIGVSPWLQTQKRCAVCCSDDPDSAWGQLGLLSQVHAAVDWDAWWAAIGPDVSVLVLICGGLSAISLYIAYQQASAVPALIFHGVGVMGVVLMLKWPCWYSQYAWRTTENKIGCIGRLKRRWSLDRFDYGNQDNLKMVIVSELIEVGSQLYNLLTLDADTDMVPLVVLVALLVCNLIFSWSLMLCNSHSKYLGLYVMVTDMVFDYAYLVFTVAVRDLQQLDVGVIVVILIPLLTGMRRNYSIISQVAAARFTVELQDRIVHAPSSKSRPKRLATTSVMRVATLHASAALPSTEVGAAGQAGDATWRPHSRGLTAFGGFLIAFGLVLGVVTAWRVTQQYVRCQDEVGSVAWGASYPKALAPSGFLSSLGCGYQFVDSLEIHSTRLTDLQPLVQKYTSLKSLDVSQCALTSVPSAVATLSSLSVLNVQNNRITYVDPAVFDMELEQLVVDGNPFMTSVNWAGTSIRFLPTRFVSVVKDTITYLDVSHTQLDEVPLNQLGQMTHLVHADLSNCQLSSWPLAVTHVLQSLLHFNLSHNALQQVDRFILGSTFVWKTIDEAVLDLSYNSITRVFPNIIAFPGTLHLQGNGAVTVYPSYTVLSTLNPEVFKYATFPSSRADFGVAGWSAVPTTLTECPAAATLQQLHMGFCRLGHVSTYTFQSFPNLRYLAVPDNAITSVAPGAFASNPRLQKIDLYGNSLTSLPASLFQDTPDLYFIRLYSNKLTYLPPTLFSTNTRLYYIKLNDNLLTHFPLELLANTTAVGECIPAGAFATFSGVRLLKLSDNLLPTLNATLLDNMTITTHMYLSYNQITALPSDIFRFNTKLTDLYLDNNKLTAVPEGIFSTNSVLRVLLLNANALSSIPHPSSLFASSSSPVQVLRLQYNALTSLPAGFFTSMPDLSLLYLHDNQLTALPDGGLTNHTRLHTVQLNRNQLTSVPQFKDIETLHTVYLSGNPLTSLPYHPFENCTSLYRVYLTGTGLNRTYVLSRLSDLQLARYQSGELGIIV